ncbi:MAG: penicillin-binding protein 2 [Gaiellales bacterium]
MSSGAFLPPDPRVEEPYRLTPRTAIRLAILGVVAVVLFGVLFFRLWALQVISGEEYLESARDNQVRTFRIQAPRGPILDRSGRPLVTNVPGTVVQLWPAYVPEGQLESVVTKLSALLEVPRGQLLKAARARLEDPLTPLVVKTDVRDPKADYLSEHSSEFPGVKLEHTQLRHYEDDSLAAQLLGYVGEVTKEQLEQLGPGYRGGDRIGQTGIEQAYDKLLRGEPGTGQVTVDAGGNFTSTPQPNRLPKAGYAVRLTVDADLQQAAEDALRYGIDLARGNGNWAAYGGAIVAMDPRNGEIMAMASFPSYDPGIFSGRLDAKKWEILQRPGSNYPLTNRATGGLYPPGSIFKPVTALAAMEQGMLDPYEQIQCEPERVIDGQRFRNWDPYVDEPMSLSVAMARSCDTYFYELGLRFYRAKGSPLQDWAKQMGFGGTTGVDIPDSEGLVPTPAWRKRRYSSEIDRLWKSGNSVQLAIGQGELQVTPLQMARFYALIANGGKLVQPHLVKYIEQPRSSSEQRPVILRTFGGKPPRDIGLHPENVALIQSSLWDVTHKSYGTSFTVFSGYPVQIAGKTGTAEQYRQFPRGYPGYEGGIYNNLQDQSWWCGYGPTDGNPLYKDRPLVVCAVIENGGHGGEVAAPVALKVFEEWWGVPSPPFELRESD